MEYIKNLQNELNETIAWLEKELSAISAGRANPALLDSVMIESYGSQMSIKSVASVTVEDTRTLRVSPWDKSQVKHIEKAINDAKLPVSVGSDDQGVRVSFPAMTEDTRKQMVKIAKEKLESARVRARQSRESAIKKIENEKLSDDETKELKDKVQKEIDKTNEALDKYYAKKEVDIMTV